MSDESPFGGRVRGPTLDASPLSLSVPLRPTLPSERSPPSFLSSRGLNGAPPPSPTPTGVRTARLWTRHEPRTTGDHL